MGDPRSGAWQNGLRVLPSAGPSRPAYRGSPPAGSFFRRGSAGAGSVLAAGAHQIGRRATAMKLWSLAMVTLSAAAFVHDLGRPDRFGNMLRVFNPTSPMSMAGRLPRGAELIPGTPSCHRTSGWPAISRTRCGTGKDPMT
ncbi:polysulfide reductase NrfD [Streptomyces sp. SID13666]|nr:polysulfide reductase NrfD [Streptomyces sp. SID13666]NEA75884.1 polysulfide reductase NrfD [Streptomyces sp. SID13588]